jgi:hypothetical protein
VVLFLVITLVAGVVLVGVVVLVEGVELLPLGVVGDEVGVVTTLEATPKLSPPLLAEFMQGAELSCQQGNIVVGDALILLIRSCGQGRQDKLQTR